MGKKLVKDGMNIKSNRIEVENSFNLYKRRESYMRDLIKEAVIVAYGRSAVAKAHKGSLRNSHPVDFAGQVLKGVLEQVPQLKSDEIDDIVMGCARPEGVQGSNVARLIGQRAGLSTDVPGQTLTRFCSSGLQSIATAANAIMAGQANVMIAGGVEFMTAVGMGTPVEFRSKWLEENVEDMYIPMGLTAENVAVKYNITREEMEMFAVNSHDKAALAQDLGRFDKEIIPVVVPGDDGTLITFNKDEGIRRGSTTEGLQKLKPAFIDNGRVTAGTASQLSDGAGVVILMSREKAEEANIKPIARFVAHAVAGVDPGIMGIGPIKAVPKVMKLTGLSLDDMDVIELNEAFAAQALPCIDELKMDINKVNPNGGAIALGHPLGATGSILTCKALSELERINGRYALITMCIGGGMGAAGIIERL